MILKDIQEIILQGLRLKDNHMMTWFLLFSKIGINICSFTSVYLSTRKKNTNVKLGTLFGLTGQIFWWTITLHNNLYELIPVNCLFTGMWIKNFYERWIVDSIWFNKLECVKKRKV